MSEEYLEGDFQPKERNLHINFRLKEQHERDKLEEVSKYRGLDASAFLRSSILKSWLEMKKEQRETKNGN